MDEHAGVAAATSPTGAASAWETQDRHVRILVAFYAVCLVAVVVAAGFLAGSAPPVAEAPLVEVRATTSDADLGTH